MFSTSEFSIEIERILSSCYHDTCGGTCIMISLRCTEHPRCTHDIPPMYSWYPPDVLNTSDLLMISPRCTEHTYRVITLIENLKLFCTNRTELKGNGSNHLIKQVKHKHDISLQYNTIQYNANGIQYNTMQYNTIQYNTIDLRKER